MNFSRKFILTFIALLTVCFGFSSCRSQPDVVDTGSGGLSLNETENLEYVYDFQPETGGEYSPEEENAEEYDVLLSDISYNEVTENEPDVQEEAEEIEEEVTAEIFIEEEPAPEHWLMGSGYFWMDFFSNPYVFYPLTFHCNSVIETVGNFFVNHVPEPLDTDGIIEFMQKRRILSLYLEWHWGWGLYDLPIYFPNLRYFSTFKRCFDTYCVDFFTPLAELSNLRSISITNSGLTHEALNFLNSLGLDYIHVNYHLVMEGAFPGRY